MNKKRKRKGGWTVWDCPDGTVQVAPDNDSDIHILKLGCKCKPRVEQEPDSRIMVIHNSFDSREYFEKGTEKVLPKGD